MQRVPFRVSFLLGVVMTAGSALCASAQQAASGAAPSNGLVVEWARTFLATDGTAQLSAVATDTGGNVYAAGMAKGPSDYRLSADIRLRAAASAPPRNVLLAKYDASGKAQWALTVKSGTRGAVFSGLAVDTQANIYAVGALSGDGAFDFGDGVTLSGCASSSALIVKYDAQGKALWARCTASSAGKSGYSQDAVDRAGNLYAVGFLGGKSALDFGSRVTLTGTGNAPLVVKYNPSGAPQWARTLAAGDGAFFSAAAVDPEGGILAAGSTGSSLIDFGNGVNAAGRSVGHRNVLLVKYDAAGTPRWARTLTRGSDDAVYSGVAVDAAGNAYAAGECSGTDTYGLGNGISAAGSAPTIQGGPPPNVLLVKYDKTGVPQWARTLAGGDYARFNGVAVDPAGNVYAAGAVWGGSYDFGAGVTASPSSVNGSAVLVKYSASGIPQAARSITSTAAAFSARDSNYLCVAIDGRGAVYVAGTLTDGSYDFGDRITVSGAGGRDLNQILLVKYRDESAARATPAEASSAAPPVAIGPAAGIVNDSRVRLRSAPNLQADTLRYMTRGEKVTVIGRSSEHQKIGAQDDYWYQVRTSDGVEGWAYGGFIDFPEGAPR